MNRVQFKLKDGTVREFEPDHLVSISATSRKIGLLILVCGAVIDLIGCVNIFVAQTYDYRVLIGAFFIVFGWMMFKVAPRKDENTIEDGFVKYKGKVLAKDVSKLRFLGSAVTLIDDADNKISPIKEIREVGE